MTADEIADLEAMFPLQADSAFAAARQEAMVAGFSVMEAKDGSIWEVFPNGRRELVKVIQPPFRVGLRQFVIPPAR